MSGEAGELQTCGSLRLGVGAHVSCIGKGRKQRITPLTTQTVTVMRAWARERAGRPDDPLFATSTGGQLSRDALERRLTKHAATAAAACPSLAAKAVTPHVLRHTAAMRLLHAGVDTTVIGSGSATSRSRPPRSTCTPTSPSKRRRSQGPHRRPPSPTATTQATASSRSSTRCDMPTESHALPP